MARILQITPHRLFPPRAGRRAFFFLRELALRHEVHAIFPQAKAELAGVREDYEMPAGVTVYSPLDTPPPRTVFDLAPGRLGPALHYRWLRRSLEGPTAGEVLQIWSLLKTALRGGRFDIVIFDHIQTLRAVPLVRRWSPGSVLMLNAHNVDAMLYGRLAETADDPAERAEWSRRTAAALRVESNLASLVDGYWACSEEDHREFQALNGGKVPGYAIPNGIAPEVLPFDPRPDKRQTGKVLFCGSLNYEPNRRGLEWFRREVWPAVKARAPGVRLVVIGFGAGPSDFPELRADPQVDFVGEVDKVPPWYHQTSISVVPILEGSGTRVKILEAMTLGNPVVSTTIGAEGIAAVDGRHILLRDDPAGFAQAVADLLGDEALFGSLQSAGRELIDTVYDWRVVGRELDRTIDDILARRAS